MNLLFFNIYIISGLLLLMFIVVDFLMVDITVDDELGLKANRILLAICVILIPIVNTVVCAFYFIMYFRKAMDILNQDSKF